MTVFLSLCSNRKKNGSDFVNREAILNLRVSVVDVVPGACAHGDFFA
jgi:hypothetical protein